MKLPPGPLGVVAKNIHRVIGVRRKLRGPLRPSWSHELETFAAFLRRFARASIYLPVARQRKMSGTILSQSDVVATTEIEPVLAGGVPGAWFRRADSDPNRVLYYLHGGGYVIGSIETTHTDLLCRMCRASGATVLAIDYRLAPEHPFPAQIDDSLAAYRWLLGRGIDPAKVVIGGESAGGGLTMSTLLSLRDGGEPLPAAAVVISPWVDLETTSTSFRSNHRYDYLNRRTIKSFARHFVPDPSRRRDPYAAPVHADLTGLPPLLVHVGGAEVFLDQGVRLARNARLAGVDTELDVWQDMIHAWHIFAGFLPEGRDAIEHVGQFVKRHTVANAARVRAGG